MTPLTYQTAEAHIAHTLLREPSERKWTIYQSHFQDIFTGRWPRFDELISFISDFFVRFSLFPTLAVYASELNATNQPADGMHYGRLCQISPPTSPARKHL